MACGPSLLEVLDEDDWNFEDIKKLLEHNPSSVNEFSTLSCGIVDETPLHRVLLDSESSLDLVKLLLNYGADVNCRDSERATPLSLACSYDREDVIRVLLEKGADVNLVGTPGVSPLCQSLSNYAMVSTIRLLLDAGSSLDACQYHNGSVMLCATDRDALERKHMSVLQILIEKGADMNAVDRKGRSPLCHALGSGSELCVIEMLLAAGGSLSACTKHNSPLQCATFTGNGSFTGNGTVYRSVFFNGCATLRSDVIEMLLQFVKVHDSEQLTDTSPLHDAISYFPCEEKVIELFLDHLQIDENVLEDNVLGGYVFNIDVSDDDVSDDDVSDGDVSDGDVDAMYDNILNGGALDESRDNLLLMYNSNTLLQVAVLNHCCKPSIVKLLIKRGYPVDWVNNDGDTVLHLAVSHKYVSADVIEALLENGAVANVENLSGENPLHVAIKNIENVDIFKLLFMAGARIGATGYFSLKHFVDKCTYQQITWYDYEDKQTNSYDLENKQSNSFDFEDEYSTARKRFDCCKMLFKCCFLENPKFQIDRLIRGHRFYEEISRFGAICEREVREMSSKTVGQGYWSLREFLVEDSLHHVTLVDCAQGAKNYDFNKLLGIIDKNSFPVYFDIITAKVGFPVMRQKLQEVEVYYQRYFSGQAQRVAMDYLTVYAIAKYLTKEDLLRFISAFHKMNPHIFSV